MRASFRFFLVVVSTYIISSSQAQSNLKAQWLVQPYLPLVTGPLTKNDAAITKTGETYVIGRFTNGADFATGDDTIYVAAPKENSQFLAKYDKAGKLIFAKAMTGSVPNYANFLSVATDAEGNAYITGLYGTGFDFDPGPGVVTLPTAEYYDSELFFAKYNKDGELLFARSIGSRNDKSVSSSIAVDKQNNICIAGIVYGYNNDFDPGAGVVSLNADTRTGNAFFAKYDANGNYLFANMLAADNASDVAFDQSNNILLAGTYSNKVNDFDPGPATAKLTYKKGGDLFFAKYSPAGNYIFAKSVGGASADYVSSIIADSRNNIIIGGSFADSADFDPGSRQLVRVSKDAAPDLFVETFDSLGNYKWVTTAGGTGGDLCTALAIDKNRNVFATGYFSGNDAVFSMKSGSVTLSSAGSTDIFYSCYDSLGGGIFVKSIGSAKADYVQNILLQPSGNLSISGNYTDSLDFNPSTQRNLLRTYINTAYFATYSSSSGAYIAASDIDVYQYFTNASTVDKTIQDKAGNTYMLGTFQGIVDFDPGIGTYYLTSTHNINTDIFNTRGDNFFAKYDKNGKLVFVKRIVGTTETQISGITTDDNQNIYLTGYYTGTINLSPETDTAIFGSGFNYLYNSFFARYDNYGNYQYSKNFGTGGFFTSIALDKNRNIYITSNFSGKAAFNPADTSIITRSFGGADMAILNYDNNGNFISVKHVGEKGGSHSVYPYDMKITTGGRIVICGEFNGAKTDFNPGSGTYYLSSGRQNSSYFTASYTLSGGFVFAATADTTGTGFSYATEVALDGEDIVIKGRYGGKVDLDPRPDRTAASNYTNHNPFFMKYSSTGTIRFINTNLANESLMNAADIGGIAVDTFHNIYVGGYYSGKTDFDYGSDTAFLYGGTTFLAKYNDTGAYVYATGNLAYSYPNSGYGISSLYINRQNDIIIAGSATGTVNFNPDGNELLFKSQRSEFFVVKYKEMNTNKTAPVLIALNNSKNRNEAGPSK